MRSAPSPRARPRLRAAARLMRGVAPVRALDLRLEAAVLVAVALPRRAAPTSRLQCCGTSLAPMASPSPRRPPLTLPCRPRPPGRRALTAPKRWRAGDRVGRAAAAVEELELVTPASPSSSRSRSAPGRGSCGRSARRRRRGALRVGARANQRRRVPRRRRADPHVDLFALADEELVGSLEASASWSSTTRADTLHLVADGLELSMPRAPAGCGVPALVGELLQSATSRPTRAPSSRCRRPTSTRASGSRAA